VLLVSPRSAHHAYATTCTMVVPRKDLTQCSMNVLSDSEDRGSVELEPPIFFVCKIKSVVLLQRCNWSWTQKPNTCN
jgi:hypothetical protein